MNNYIIVILIFVCCGSILYGLVSLLLKDTSIGANGYYIHDNDFIIITKNSCTHNGNVGTIEYYKGNNFIMTFKDYEITGFYGDYELKILKAGDNLNDTHKFITFKMGRK